MADFYIFRQIVGDKIHSKYFRSWIMAEEFLRIAVSEAIATGNFFVERKNWGNLATTGLTVREVLGKNKKGENVKYLLLDGNFSD